MDNLLHTSFVLAEDLLDSVCNMLFFHDDVLDANCEPMIDEPIVNNLLCSTHEISADLRSEVFDDDVIKSLTCGPNDTFIDRTTQ